MLRVLIVLAIAFAAARPSCPGSASGTARPRSPSSSTTRSRPRRWSADVRCSIALQGRRASAHRRSDAGRSSLARHRRWSRARRLPRCTARRARAHRAVGGSRGSRSRARPRGRLGARCDACRRAASPSRPTAQRTAWATAVARGRCRSRCSFPPARRRRIAPSLAASAEPARWTPRGAVTARVVTRDSVRLSHHARRSHARARRRRRAASRSCCARARPSAAGSPARVELEPDEFPADDARHFARVDRPPPRGRRRSLRGPVRRDGAQHARRRRSRATAARRDIASPPPTRRQLPALIVRAADPVRLGAANRALERLGHSLALRRARPRAGHRRGGRLDGVAVSERYELVARRRRAIRHARHRRWRSVGRRAARATCSSARVSIPPRPSFPCARRSCPGSPTCSRSVWVRRPATWALRSTRCPARRAPPRWRGRRWRAPAARVAPLTAELIDAPAERGVWFFCSGGAPRRRRRRQRAARRVEPRSHDSPHALAARLGGVRASVAHERRRAGSRDVYAAGRTRRRCDARCSCSRCSCSPPKAWRSGAPARQAA